MAKGLITGVPTKGLLETIPSMIYESKELPNGFTALTMYCFDDIRGSMEFYRKGDFLTDDKYFHFQCECAGWSDEQIDKIMTKLAKIFDCKYQDEEITNTKKNHAEGLANMVQCATAICTMIIADESKIAKINWESD